MISQPTGNIYRIASAYNAVHTKQFVHAVINEVLGQRW